MKVSHKSPNGRIEVFAEGETQKDVFKQLAFLQEVFEESKCGVCKSEDLRFVVRNVDDNDFYEMHCLGVSCRARLAFGQNKKGGSLFPKRKDAESKWLSNNGWSKWEGKKE